MSNVIDFLERMGQDAKLRHAVGEEFETALAAADIDPAVRAALVDADQSRLEALLGASANVCCMVQKPDPDEGEGVEEEDDDDADDDDADDEKTKSQRLGSVDICNKAARGSRQKSRLLPAATKPLSEKSASATFFQ